MSYRYERSRLADQEWHKIVMWTEGRHHGPYSHSGSRLALREKIKTAVDRFAQEPVMLRWGSDWNVIMVASDEDYVALKLALDIKPNEYRGKGDWTKRPYGTNRMRPS